MYLSTEQFFTLNQTSHMNSTTCTGTVIAIGWNKFNNDAHHKYTGQKLSAEK